MNKTPQEIGEELKEFHNKRIDQYIHNMLERTTDYIECLNDPNWDWVFDYHEWDMVNSYER